jgi:hypothetical protein
LSQNLRVKHREGVAHILHYSDKWERYKSLSVVTMLEGLVAALSDRQPYFLLPDAFFTEDQNLRKERLESLFTSVGLKNPWGWIEKHHIMVDFIINYRGEANTVEKELLDFIRYRNDAAHGFTQEILGSEALLEICRFVLCMCWALTEYVRRTLLKCHLELGRAAEIGRVTEVYQQGRVIVAKMKVCKVCLDDRLYFVGNRRCPVATIRNLRDNDIDVSEIETADGQEVGFELDVPVKKKLRIVKLGGAAEQIGDYVI